MTRGGGEAKVPHPFIIYAESYHGDKLVLVDVFSSRQLCAPVEGAK